MVDQVMKGLDGLGRREHFTAPGVQIWPLSDVQASAGGALSRLEGAPA